MQNRSDSQIEESDGLRSSRRRFDMGQSSGSDNDDDESTGMRRGGGPTGGIGLPQSV